jgi:signal transduction histidine kinase
MIVDAVRSLWTEPRAPGSTSPRWPDWLATAVLAVLAIVEGVLRDDLERPAVAVAFGLALLLLLPWRRARPLVVAVSVFGALKAFDLATVGAGGDPDQSLLWQNVWVLALPFALLRWGSGRQIALGSVVMAIVPLTGHSLADAVFGLLLFTSSGALGVAFRFRAAARTREVDQVRSREREQLARELHDTVAHHVSAIAVQAQAGRAVAAADPGRAADVLEVIEEAASRTLAEMRAMVGVLRDGGAADLTPQGGLPDIERLAGRTGDGPRVEVVLSGDLDDLSAQVGAAVYRLAQESVTNALRHARRATCVEVRLTGDPESVRLTVHDDGEVLTGDRVSRGYGIVGMTERATLLGGTLTAGPGPRRGWTVDARLPRSGAAT